MQERNTSQEGSENSNLTETQKVIEQHLQDENHEITDEHIRNVKVGEVSEPATIGGELEARFEDEIKEDEEGKEGKTPSKPLTPWDTIDG
jgi:hypothetical protein